MADPSKTGPDGSVGFAVFADLGTTRHEGHRRRRRPVVEFRADYALEEPEGTVSLLDLFDGRRQPVVYHCMFEPGDKQVCATGRGVDRLRFDLNVLDHPALGRPRDVGGLAGRLAADPGVLVAAGRRVRAAEGARGLVIALHSDVRALFDGANTADMATLMRDGHSRPHQGAWGGTQEAEERE